MLTELSLSVSEAKARILEDIRSVELETTHLTACLGRVLGEPIIAGMDIPPFSNSAMDGFAIRSKDSQSASRSTPIQLKVVEDIRAGKKPRLKIESGDAARIMTGAIMPYGADAVVPVEDTSMTEPMLDSDPPEEIKIFSPLRAGEYVRPQGQDVGEGETILRSGKRLLVHDVAMLAALGEKDVRVYRKPRAAIVSTGDELLDVEDPIEAGKIRDSNSYALHAAIQRIGGEALLLGISKDDPDSLRIMLNRGVEEDADILLTTAGVSMGAYDYVREVVMKHGTVSFWRVNLRPGKPLLVGTYRGKPIFGLPGNPVSVAVTFELFVRPALEKMMGLEEETYHRVKVAIDHEITSDGRESYLRARIRWEGEGYHAELTGSQDSGVLSSMVHANALVRVPDGTTRVEKGSKLEAWILDGALIPLMDEVKKRYE